MQICYNKTGLKNINYKWSIEYKIENLRGIIFMEFFDVEMKETQVAGFIGTMFKILNTGGFGPGGTPSFFIGKPGLDPNFPKDGRLRT